MFLGAAIAIAIAIAAWSVVWWLRAPAPAPDAGPVPADQGGSPATQHPPSPRVAGAAGTSATPTETSDQVRARLARQALEQRTRSDARYREYAARWATEQRDEPWSTDQERGLRRQATASGLDHLLFELECRLTLCRVEISAADSDTAFALQRARASPALLGTAPGASIGGGGPDRVLEVFAAREGMGLPKGP